MTLLLEGRRSSCMDTAELCLLMGTAITCRGQADSDLVIILHEPVITWLMAPSQQARQHKSTVHATQADNQTKQACC